MCVLLFVQRHAVPDRLGFLTASLPEQPTHILPPQTKQVWDFQRSAEMRDTEGGASRRSVLEQVAKLRTYLVQQA